MTFEAKIHPMQPSCQGRRFVLDLLILKPNLIAVEMTTKIDHFSRAGMAAANPGAARRRLRHRGHVGGENANASIGLIRMSSCMPSFHSIAVRESG